MAIEVYFPALSSDSYIEGPPGFYSYPVSLVENPPGSGLYDIPAYLIPEGGDIYSIPLELLGLSGGGTSNLKMFSVQEDATPIDPSSSAGGVGQITVGLDSFPDAPRLIGEIVLTDGSRGKTSGTVRSINVADGALALTADSVLGKFNTDRTAIPFTGDLKDAIQYYCDLVGITNDVFVDTTVASRDVVYPGWVGNVWVHIKQLLAVEQVEMALVFDRVYVRPLRQLVANQDKLISGGYTVDNSGAAQKVEVYYYNHLSGADLEVYPPAGEDVPAPFTVNAGETIRVTQQLSASLTLVSQPECIDFVNNQSYAGTNGVYSVVGTDNLPVPASQWIAQGGDITISVTDDPSIIEIAITGAADPGGNLSPYRIAMSSGSGNDYNSLHITGSGVTWDKKMITLRTGATNATTSTIVGVTVDNPFLSTREQAYSVGLQTSKAYAGVNYIVSGSALDVNRNGDGDALIQATIADFNMAVTPGTTITAFNALWAGEDISDFNEYWDDQIKTLWSNQLFGNAPGARVLETDANFRITSATTTESTVQFNASLDTLIRDFSTEWSDTGSTTVVRTNKATNPSVEVDSTNWGQYFTPTITRDNGWAAEGTWSRKLVKTASTIQGHIYSQPAVAAAIVPGDVVTVGVSLMAPTGGTVVVAARGQYTGTPATMEGGSYGAGGQKTVTLVAGVPQRVTLTYTIPAFTGTQTVLNNIGFQANQTGELTGWVMYADGATVEEGVTSGSLFSGATLNTHVDGVTTTHAWVGTANASASTQTVITNDFRISDFNAQFSGMTMKDYAVIPLRKDY